MNTLPQLVRSPGTWDVPALVQELYGSGGSSEETIDDISSEESEENTK